MFMFYNLDIFIKVAAQDLALLRYTFGVELAMLNICWVLPESVS